MNQKEIAENTARRAKEASRSAAELSTSQKNGVLASIAEGLVSGTAEILKANVIDVENARASGQSDAFIDRLTLTPERIKNIASAVKDIIQLEDPVGNIEKMITRPSGIRVGRMRVPVGVVMVIYESRPNVTIDIASLCVKSGNAAILRGGKESLQSNLALHAIVKNALSDNGFSSEIIQLVDNPDREILNALLKMNSYIDIVVPRGGRGLITAVTEQSTIPVIKHDKGVCHTFVDRSAKKDMAERIAINAKVQRPGVCNAMETLLVHKDYPYAKELFQSLLDMNVELRGCGRSISLIPGRIKPAVDEDWGTEYEALILSVKIVDDMDQAIRHIHTYGSGHSEAIVTEDYSNAQAFLRKVDSAAVMVNASTRFHDGGELGLGAEVGISTQKLHARGAMGIEGLTCLKFVVYGQGEVRK
jgi:glutamate-5-semialdehyde dehydrogenase